MPRKHKPTETTNADSVPAVSTTPLGEILTVGETAALLKVPPSSIYEWTRFRGSNRGAPLPHRRVGKYIRFLRSEVEAWLVGLPKSTNTRKRHYVRKHQVAA